MEWFEKEYKNRFENESSLEGVESGPLWDQISKSIPQQKPAKKVVPWRWTLLTLVLVVVILSWFFLLDNNDNKDMLLSQTIPNIQTTENQSTTKTLASNAMADKKSIIYNQENNEIENTTLQTKEGLNISKVDINSNSNFKNESQSLPSNDLIENAEDLNKNRTSLNDSNELDNRNNTTDSNTTISKNDLVESKENIPVEESTIAIKSPQLDNSIQGSTRIQSKRINSNLEENNTTLTGTNEFESAESIKTKDEKSERSKDITNRTTPRESIELDMLDLLAIDEFERNENIKTPSVAPVKIIVESRNPFAFQIQASANFFDLKYSDDQNTELFADSANESLGALQLGNSFGVKMDYYLDDSWSISTGVELSNYENQLNTVLTSDIMQLDTLQRIRNVYNVRTVKHHNKLTTLSIPVSIAYENHISDRWSIGTSIGMSYALANSQSGRLLGRDNTILDYSQEENSQFTNFVSFRINPYLKYKLGSNIALSLSAGLSLQSHGQSEVLELNRNSKIYSIGMGLQYKM